VYLDDPTPAGKVARIRWARQNYAEAKRLTAEMQTDWFGRYHWPAHRRKYQQLLAKAARRQLGDGDT